MAYRFKRKESAAAALRRITGEQLGKAMSELEGDADDRHDAVHQVRKRFKKIRGLLRLVRPGLGDPYSEANAFYRDAGRRLSRVRDAESILEAVERLNERRKEPLEKAQLADVERRLIERRQRIADEWLDLDDEMGGLKETLNAARRDAEKWSIDGKCKSVVLKGLAKTYKRGLGALSEAAETRDDQALHEWRKRMKYHWYHLRLLRNVWKPVMRARIAALDELCDLIGDDHDLVVLGRTIEQEPEVFGSKNNIKLLRRVIEEERAELQHAAFRLGRYVCAEPADALADRIGGYWKVWKQGA